MSMTVKMSFLQLGMMLDKYDVRENKWLIDLFKLNEKWAQVYVKRTFTVGMKTT